MSERIRKGATNASPYDYERSNPMSHEEALEMNAVELYVLKDLTAEQEVRFEEHYFECQECAGGVAVEQALIANAGAAHSAERTQWWRRLAFPILAPVTALLLATVVFQNFQSSPLNANTVIVAQEVVKGGEPKGKSVTTPSVTIEINLPPDEAASNFYRVSLLGEGKPPLSKTLPAPEGTRLSLQLLSRTLSAGSYNVVVYGLTSQDAKDGPQIGQYFFNIKLIQSR